MTSFISITQLMRAQVEAYQRATWFIIECMEREHRLTLRALASTWTQAVRGPVDRSVDRRTATGAGTESNGSRQSACS